MFVLLTGLAVVLLPISQAIPVDIGSRIVNGTDADIKDYPYMISLRFNGGHTCGGSIIDEYNVLTAAHCVQRDTANFSVLVGSSTIRNYSTALIAVEKIVFHESYINYLPYSNDVAVVQLVQPLEFNENVQPIQLPAAFDPIPQHSPAVLTGWGLDKTNGTLTNTLQEVEIVVYSDSECETLHSETGPTSRIFQVCAGIPDGGKGQCNGDSGGPLVVDGIQIGIVSWSVKPCTREGYPGVFAKVSTYIDWIKCNLKKA